MSGGTRETDSAARVASGCPQSASAPDFSLVLGGPIYQMFLRARLATPGLDLLRRRLLGIPAFAWLPLMALALVEGRLVGGPSPLLRDIEVHARLLLSIPLLIAAEVVAHQRVAGIVRQFRARGLIAPKDEPRFDAAIASAMRLRNSVTAEVIQFALAFALHWIGGRALLLVGDSWRGTASGDAFSYSASGVWYAFVALPVFRILVFRWYFRTFIWYRFLWQVRKLDLRLDALHPDRCAGLGFLAGSPLAFTPLLLAHSVMVAGFIQQRIWATGATLPDFKFEIAGTIAVAMALVLPPLFFYVAKIGAEKRAAAAFGALASRYVAEFRAKWLGGTARKDEALVGSADIQSLADLSGAFDAVRETQLVPLTRHAVVQLIIVTGIPFMPLVLNMVPFEDLLMRAAGLLF